jgi:hypothetical protein
MQVSKKYTPARFSYIDMQTEHSDSSLKKPTVSQGYCCFKNIKVTIGMWAQKKYKLGTCCVQG